MPKVKRRLAAILTVRRKMDGESLAKYLNSLVLSQLSGKPPGDLWVEAVLQIIALKIRQHGGRILPRTGLDLDTRSAEFPNVVDAVLCADQIQRAVFDHNAQIPDAKHIELQIGVAFGEVVIDGDRVLGEAVDIAARLARLRKPGPLFITPIVRDQVGSSLGLPVDDWVIDVLPPLPSEQNDQFSKSMDNALKALIRELDAPV